MTKIEGYRQLENIGNYEIWYGSYRIDGKTCMEQVKAAVLGDGSSSPSIKLDTVMGRTIAEVKAELIPGSDAYVSQCHRISLGWIGETQYFKRENPNCPHYDGIYLEESKKTRFYCHLEQWETSEAYQTMHPQVSEVLSLN
jgi:hypothetical protein